MKTFLTLAFAAIVGLSYGQKIQTNEASADIGGGNHNALIINLPGANPDDVEKQWKSKLKKMGGKTSSKKNEFFTDDAEMKQMGDNTFDVYSRVEKDGDEGTKLIVAVDLGGAYMSSGTHPEKFKIIKSIMYDFSVETMKEIIGDEIKEEEKALSDLEKEQKDLEKENSKLHDDIEDYKKKIEEAEEAIEDNKKEQEKKKEEIGAQKEKVKAVKAKQRDVK